MAEHPSPAELNEQMFAAVGRAITQWSFVEAELSALFVVCAADGFPRDRGIQFVDKWWVATQVFHAIESFNAKRTLVDAAVTALISSEIPNADEWKAEWAR